MNTSAPVPELAGKQPWWRYKMLWLVVGGPLAVVVASLITAYVAISGQDPVLSREEINKSAKQGVVDGMTPAMQARNHIAGQVTKSGQ